MLAGKKILAVIPARGGSKRLPGKNVKSLFGKPLINWTLEAALNSSFIDTVLVSSDCDVILQTVLGYGVLIEKRASSLAEDYTSSAEVALDILARHPGYDILVWLQPTSPLRKSHHIDEALQLVQHGKHVNRVVSVCELECPASFMGSLCTNTPKLGREEVYVPLGDSWVSQKLYKLNGAIYINNVAEFLQLKSFNAEGALAYLMPRTASVDIDTAIDFYVAEALIRYSLD